LINHHFHNNFNFNEGLLFFKNNQVYYLSTRPYEGDDYCFDSVCYTNNNGSEKIYSNLSSPYTFQEDLELNTGEYTLFFTNIKNESKISIILK